jgi:hypothetical protein
MYVLWGLFHILAARNQFVRGQSLELGVVQGLIYQHAWNLLFFAVFSIIVGLWLNWKNDRLGYWLNLVVVSAADVGFVVFVLIPGHVPMVPGGVGPLLWILAVGFSTLGILSANRERAQQSAP